MGKKAIVIRNLSKSFGDLQVLRHLNMEIQPDTCNVLMGPSGQGKTTLLRILMGLEQADDGAIENLPQIRSAVFQEDRLCEDFTAVDNVAMVMAGRRNHSLIRKHLAAVGLADAADKPVSQLSGGMRRRVALVRSILADSDMILLDEPFKGLDDASRQTVVDYFLANTKGKTTLVVTHDPEEAEMLGANRLKL